MDKDKVLKILASNVKKVRLNDNRISQKEVYECTGIHVGRIEQGKRDISFSTIVKLAEFHGIDPCEYFEGIIINKTNWV